MKAVKEINFLSHIFQKTVFHRERTVFWIWMSSGLIYAIVKLLIGKYNNYKIFENVFPHVINGLHLYVEYPTEYYDVNHYGPIFALVIAPFSILPEWLGMIFWILMNTYFLFYAIRQLPFNESQRIIVYWYSLCELMTAQGVQQFNISVGFLLDFIGNINKNISDCRISFFLFFKTQIASCIFLRFLGMFVFGFADILLSGDRLYFFAIYCVVGTVGNQKWPQYVRHISKYFFIRNRT